MSPRRLAIAYHWVTAALVVAVLTVGWLHGGMEDPDTRTFWLDVHRCIGLSILAVTALRLIDRLAFGPAASREDLPLILRWASRLSHGAIFVALLVMPLLGWAQSSARAHHFKLFGVVLPSLLARDPQQADHLQDWHAKGAWLLVILLAIHAAAALYHHFVRRDDVLRCMIGMVPTARGSRPYEEEA